jgi:hypothetical protein
VYSKRRLRACKARSYAAITKPPVLLVNPNGLLLEILIECENRFVTAAKTRLFKTAERRADVSFAVTVDRHRAGIQLPGACKP